MAEMKVLPRRSKAKKVAALVLTGIICCGIIFAAVLMIDNAVYTKRLEESIENRWLFFSGVPLFCILCNDTLKWQTQIIYKKQ